MVLHNDIWGDTSVTPIEERAVMGTVPVFER